MQAPYTHPVTAWRARAYSFALRASRGAGRASIATTLPLQKFVSHVLLGACNWPHVAWCCSPLPQCGVHAGLGEVDTVSWLRGRAGTQFLREVWRREQLYEVWAVRFFLCPWAGLVRLVRDWSAPARTPHTAILLGLSSLPQTR